MAPPKMPKKQQSDALRFRVDGVVYVVDRAELTPKIERELFQQSDGLTLARAIEALKGGAGFGLAALVFLARRQADEAVVYQKIEDDLWAAQQAAGGEFDVDLLVGDEDGDENPPE